MRRTVQNKSRSAFEMMKVAPNLIFELLSGSRKNK